MNFKATIGTGTNDADIMDVSAPDFSTAEEFVRSEAKGEAFSVWSLDGQSFTVEPSAEVMAEIQVEIESGKLCPDCCFRLVLPGCSLCRKCIVD